MDEKKKPKQKKKEYSEDELKDLGIFIKKNNNCDQDKDAI